MSTALFESMGWIGATCFALCALPQAVQCYKRGNAQGINNIFLVLWFVGEVLTFCYVWPSKAWPLLVNYILNFLFLLVIIRYRIWPRR